VSLKNDLGLDLSSTISRIESSLLLKEKSSPNLLDAFIAFDSTKWDRTEYLRIADMLCDGLANEADIENGIHKVILIPGGSDFMGKLYSELHGLKFGTGGSILAGKIGEKLFSEDFTLYQSNSAEDGMLNNHFFDAEGTVNEAFRYTLIENGVLKTPYTDKKTAKQYNLEHTGAAGAAYDSVPSLVPTPLVIKKSEKTIKALMNGEKAMFVMFAQGGDFTPEGKYATPVQTSFLFDGEKFIGKLPQLNITSNVFDMFGKDFLGVSSDSFTSLSHMPLTFMNMKIEKI
jgi:PmbA protein